jgi:hypothetical protein
MNEQDMVGHMRYAIRLYGEETLKDIREWVAAVNWLTTKEQIFAFLEDKHIPSNEFARLMFKVTCGV